MSLFLLVSVSVCNEEILILEDEFETYSIDFFNLIFYSDSDRIEACQYIMDSETITLEKEPLVQNGFYIYTDDRLFQEIAIENKWAKININYPEYLHKIKEDEMVISKEEKIYNKNNNSILILTTLFILFIVSLFIYMAVSKL